MDFKLSDEQQALRDTLAKFISKDYSFEKRKAILKSPEGISREAWKQFADMGLTALGIAEENGGLGGNAFDTALVMEMFGRGLVVEPYVATMVLGTALLAAGSDAQKALLSKVAEGSLLLALAHEEPGARYDLNRVATTAKKDSSGYVLNGSKTVVLHGAQADTLVVSARTSGAENDASGITLFLVDRKAAGVTVTDRRTHDGQRAADVKLAGVKVAADARLGAEGAGGALVEMAYARGIAAICAEAVGCMGALNELTLAYIKTRKQFGVPIGSFQVLQHRMADMLMMTEQARSMMYLVAGKVESADLAERRRIVAAAKTLVGQAARYVGQQAVQLHGGIGVTDEANVSHYFKRLTLINATFGDADTHLARFSDAMVKMVTDTNFRSAAA